jgi:hypothetical protein
VIFSDDLFKLFRAEADFDIHFDSFGVTKDLHTQFGQTVRDKDLHSPFLL